jgi:hypothetical protein
MQKNFLLLAAVLGFLGVALGAFGAHGLRNRLSPEMLSVFEIGVRYQMYHVFALLCVAAAIGRAPACSVRLPQSEESDSSSAGRAWHFLLQPFDFCLHRQDTRDAELLTNDLCVFAPPR